MSKNLEKYFFNNLSKESAISHIQHKTKIVATVGPACSSYEKLTELAYSGVNVFRLNFSHGDHQTKLEIINSIKLINKTEPFNIAILADLQGPKLRVGEIENNHLPVNKNEILTLTNEKCIGTKEKIYVSYPNLSDDVKIGEIILLDDGKIQLKVTEILANKDVKVEVQNEAIILSKKGLNLPDTKTSLPALTEKDLIDLEFIMKNNCDWVALSFVRKEEDILKLKEILLKNNSDLKIIAKIEKPEAITNIDKIIEVSDGIMIARGDLGVEIPVEKIPLIQKSIILKCIHLAKPVIVATQMMESMMDKIKPNRSEVTDVANAVLDGADAVMLSGETASGMYPNEVIKMMKKIILEVEQNSYNYYRKDLISNLECHTALSDSICYNACKIAEEIKSNLIVGSTQSGYTAFTLASFRPKSPLFVFTKVKSLVTKLSLSFGVRAIYFPEGSSFDDIIFDQITILKERGFVKSKDIVISVGSTPVHLHIHTNTIKITVVD